MGGVELCRMIPQFSTSYDVETEKRDFYKSLVIKLLAKIFKNLGVWHGFGINNYSLA